MFFSRLSGFFKKEFKPKPVGQRPSLSVGITTRDSGSRLADVIVHARRFADEVIVGVDADSIDDTWEVASAYADIAYRFNHSNKLAPAYIMPFQYCRGEWVFQLDDDEYMEEGFEEIFPELLGNPLFTHYHIARKWVVSLDPPQYMHAHPWYPDYQLRLMRNDSSLFWKPPRYHTGIVVAGPGARESRYAILHYEPLVCTPDMREKKLRRYRDGGFNILTEVYYGEKIGERRLFKPLSILPQIKPKHQNIDSEMKSCPINDFPSWGSKFLEIEFSQKVAASQPVVVTLHITNTGKMTWFPQSRSWPILNVGFHIKSASGEMLEFNGSRIELSARVFPNETVKIVSTFVAPAKAGDYILTWDMVSEGECWFEQCGSETFDTPITVMVDRLAD